MRNRDLERRIAWFRDRVFARLDADRKGVTPAQSDAIRTVMDEAVLAVERLDSVPERASAFLEAQRAWQVFGTILDQHRESAHGQELQFAEICLEDAYSTLRGSVEPSVLAKLSPAPPMVLVESIESPVIFSRESSVRPTALSSNSYVRIPVPIVVVPPDHLRSPWLLTVLMHELGHHVDDCLGFSAHADKLDLAKATRTSWEGWAREVVADLLALRLGSLGLIETMKSLYPLFSHERLWTTYGEHPPLPIRVQLLRAALAGEAPSATADQARPDMPPHVTVQAQEVPEVAKAWSRVLDEQLGVPSFQANQQAIQEQAAKLLNGEPPSGPAQLVPSAAAIAAERQPDQLDQIEQGVMNAKLERPEWSVTPSQWEFVKREVASMVAPILDDTVDGLPVKRPPTELPIEHDEIAYVGATHGQLAAALETAYRYRICKWKRIDVFFLAENALAGIVSNGNSTQKKRDERSTAITELATLLARTCEEWALWEYPTAYLFGSFWSCDAPRKPGLRPRIHISPYVWERNVRTCPAVDYEAARDPQFDSESFRSYRTIPATLRRTARKIDGSANAS